MSIFAANASPLEAVRVVEPNTEEPLTRPAITAEPSGYTETSCAKSPPVPPAGDAAHCQTPDAFTSATNGAPVADPASVVVPNDALDEN